jgi:hypothetical protein
LDPDKKVFSKKSIQDKQELAKLEYEQKTKELRAAFEAVVSTVDGAKVFRYLFLICGGDLGTIRRGKDQDVDINDTLISLGTKAVWDTLRFNFKSETLTKIERHNWEDQ